MKASDPEVVTTQDNLLESLVVEEHVNGAGVGDLPGMILLVLHAAIAPLEAGVLDSGAIAGHEVRARDEPVRQVVEHLQVYRHGVSGSWYRVVTTHSRHQMLDSSPVTEP